MVGLGVSVEKAHKMKEAIAKHCDLYKIIDEMREITEKLIRESPENTQDLKPKHHPKNALT